LKKKAIFWKKYNPLIFSRRRSMWSVWDCWGGN